MCGLEAAEHHPEQFAEFMQGMVSRARQNPDPYSAEAQIVMEEMIRWTRFRDAWLMADRRE
jgi:hypothetical protein